MEPIEAIRKSDILPLAEKVAEDYPDWKFVQSSGIFKNNTLKHTTLLIKSGITFRHGICSGTPMIALNNVSINKLYKEISNYTLTRGTISYYIKPKAPEIDEFSRILNMYRSIMNIERDNPEGWIRAFVKRGIGQIHETFDLSSEASLLATLPEDYRGERGTIVSIAKCMLGDFEFVHRLRAGEIVSREEQPYYEDSLDEIIKKIPEWKQRYESQGYILKPLK